ncbi:MAG TPA: hypothetical protein PKD54_00830 [Pirellulaceae bacterium]|nr:hypothetical protein [Pirellulaceae bacterium]
MQRSLPRFVLFTEATPPQTEDGEGSWQFTLLAVNGQQRLVVQDVEWGESEERLHLLSVVRGLQSLEQPSQVSLLTSSRFVCHGIRYGLESWREHDWHWEHFGEWVSVRHVDLWKRLDGALAFPRVTTRFWRGDLWRAQVASRPRHVRGHDGSRIAQHPPLVDAPSLRIFSGDLAVAPAV